MLVLWKAAPTYKLRFVLLTIKVGEIIESFWRTTLLSVMDWYCRRRSLGYSVVTVGLLSFSMQSYDKDCEYMEGGTNLQCGSEDTHRLACHALSA